MTTVPMPLQPLQPLAEGEPDDKSSILIVDDLPEKLLVFGTLLEDLGQNLVFVRSGAEALREVLHREFAVILLDVNMPDIDGFETASLIRQYKRSAHTPIIFITAYADEMQTHRGYSLGAVDYILSPVVPEVLRSKVKVFVDLHIMQRRVRRQAEHRVALAASEAARRAAEENTRRSNFLSHVSRVLSGSLEVEVARRQLLELVVPEVAESAVLVLAEAGDTPLQALVCRSSGTGRPATVEHAFSELPVSARQAFQEVLGGRVRINLHQPETPELSALEPTPAAMAPLRLPAGAVFALVHGDRVLGALLVAGKGDTRDWPMLEELAGRAAIAFENARLYRTLEVEIDERRQAEARLRESNQRKDEFLAMLSHELRNPLAPIRNAVEVIRRVAPPDAKLIWATDVTDRQVNHLTRLVEELLDVARISQGKIVLQQEALDLQTVLSHSVETARPLLDARGHRLQVQVPPQPVWLRGDFARLSQVVSNLLNNAAKYTPEGGSIQLMLTAEDGQAQISVRDNGIGIEPELLPNVFELFEQGKRSLDRSQGGLGIGLTLVQRLVQLHNGTVVARSAGQGHGSEFVVTLPCLSEVQPTEPVTTSSQAGAQAGACRVLVVDDNLDAADTVAMYLEIEGHVVQTVADGQQALTSAATFHPDVVVLDIGLPLLDGYQVARRLRGMVPTREALLIALTGYGQKGDKQQAEEAGFDCHLVKPADPRLLADMISQWRRGTERAERKGKAAAAKAGQRTGGADGA
ncbi:hybrid sensor histidine kinase/response regulator [Ideonella sp. BN130291]|uniref:hybrid sensor histidine kinase/response regulator n=1 Tax=Ideonella sp. BN130291 TaxID=3112940 RepID=UPI002E25CC96|nr:response regulator [Ideonella sp. BN130291]